MYNEDWAPSTAWPTIDITSMMIFWILVSSLSNKCLICTRLSKNICQISHHMPTLSNNTSPKVLILPHYVCTFQVIFSRVNISKKRNIISIDSHGHLYIKKNISYIIFTFALIKSKASLTKRMCKQLIPSHSVWPLFFCWRTSSRVK